MSAQNSIGFNSYPLPLGAVFAYSGDLTTLDIGKRGSKWLLCDGSAWPQAFFPELFDVIGNIWRPAFDPNPVFYVPNLQPKTSPAEGSRVGLYISAVDDNVGVSTANTGNTGTATIDFAIGLNNMPDFTLSETRGAGDALQGVWSDSNAQPILLIDNTGASATTKSEYNEVCLPRGAGSTEAIITTTSNAQWSLPNADQENVDTTLTLTALKPPRYEMIYLIKANY